MEIFTATTFADIEAQVSRLKKDTRIVVVTDCNCYHVYDAPYTPDKSQELLYLGKAGNLRTLDMF